MFKNYTPYLGKIKLKIEKSDPHYTGRGTVLNKFYFKLGKWYVSSRMHKKQMKYGGSNIRPEIIFEIEEKTGGLIGTHTFGQENENTLENSFLSKDRQYIGDINTGYWYLENNMKVCDDYPHGVAEKEDDWGFIGYYGYSHRGGSLFRIGDRLFDETYKPKSEHYTDEQWDGWLLEMEKDKEKAIIAKNKSQLNDILRSGVASYVPFNCRGKETIKTWEEAKQSAINMSKYLS